MNSLHTSHCLCCTPWIQWTGILCSVSLILSEQFKVVMSFRFEIPHGVLPNVTYDNTSYRVPYCGRRRKMVAKQFAFLWQSFEKKKKLDITELLQYYVGGGQLAHNT